tara:strand:+ start:187 stop:423 length:237 start_codon:yes stop_codon:yes gene_type:complete
MLTLMGVEGFALAPSQGKFTVSRNLPIDRDSLVLSDILVEDSDQDAAEILRPAFDAIWNAAGLSECPFYDDNRKRFEG